MTNQEAALDAFDTLYAHLHAAAAACGQHVAWNTTSAKELGGLELGADRYFHTPGFIKPNTAHAQIAWAHAVSGAKEAGNKLWKALTDHRGLAPLINDTDPGTHTAPWIRGPLLRVGSDPTGTLAALHLGCLSPMPALGAPTAGVEAVRAGLARALAEPVEAVRHRIVVQDITAHDLSPYIGVAMGAFHDHGATRHLLVGCTTRLAPKWVVCEECPRPEGLANRHDGDRARANTLIRAQRGNQGQHLKDKSLERYVVILENDNPMWVSASSAEEAHLSLDEVGKTQTRKLWKVLD